MRGLLLMTLAGLLAGCPRALQVVDAAVELDSGSRFAADATVEADAGTRLAIWVAGATLDGGLSEFVFDAGVASVDEISFFAISASVRLKDFRVRVFDDREAVLASNDSLTTADGGFRYEINLLQPLKTGHRYVLALDAETGPSILDESGRAWDDERLTLLVRGTAQADDSTLQPQRKTRRHGK